MFEKKKILNVDVMAMSRQQLLENLKEGVLVTPNLDHIITLQEDHEFYDVYQKAEWVVCDSKILYLTMKLTGRAVPETIPGSSFFPSFYEYHKNDKDCKIFLLGAKEGVAKKAMENINSKIGWPIIVGGHSPSFGFEKNDEEIDQIIDIVNSSGANVVLVGVGAPKQEKFIMRYKDRMPGVKIWMALGATIDFEAGNVKRAPKWIQDCAMEWLFRIYCDPKRMFKRYICRDLAFFWILFKEQIGLYKNPFAKN